MSTTQNNEETPRPAMIINLAKRQSEEEPELCEAPGEEGAMEDDGEQAEPRCPSCGNSEDAPNSHELCENCVEAMEDDGWDHWDRVRECDADAFADSIDRD